MELQSVAVTRTDSVNEKDTEVVGMDQDTVENRVEKMETVVQMTAHPSKDQQSARRKIECCFKMVKLIFTVLAVVFFFVILKNILETYFEERLQFLSLWDAAVLFLDICSANTEECRATFATATLLDMLETTGLIDTE